MNKQRRDWWALLRGNQSSSWDCVVSLVANAVDAWSSRVDITVDTYGDAETRLVVRDYGEGLSLVGVRERLLTFPSEERKEDALSLGTYGVGFARVFGPHLRCGLFETGHEGIHLKVLLEPHGTYQVFRELTPFDGTEVTLFTTHPFAQAQERIQERLVEELPHLEIPVYLNGKRITSPLSLPSAHFSFSFREGDWSVVMGVGSRPHAQAELFCRGRRIATLPSPFPWTEVRVDSPFLKQEWDPHQEGPIPLRKEHRLEPLTAQGYGALFGALLDQLEGLARGDAPWDLYGQRLTALSRFTPAYGPSQLIQRLYQTPLFVGFGGRNHTLEELLGAPTIWYTGEPLLGLPLSSREEVVLNSSAVSRTPLTALLRGMGHRAELPLRNPRGAFAPFTPLSLSPTEPLRRLARALTAFGMGRHISFRGPVRIGALPPEQGSWPWFMLEEGESLLSLDGVREGLLRGEGTLCLNKNHPVVRALEVVASRDLKLALLFLLKGLSLTGEGEEDLFHLFERIQEWAP